MAFLSISGEPACGQETLARLAARKLGFELISDGGVTEMVAREFGRGNDIPARAWPYAIRAILARMGGERHWVIGNAGTEIPLEGLPDVLRAHVTAPESRRVGNLMVDFGWERDEAVRRLREMDRETALILKKRRGPHAARTPGYDLILNAEALTVEQMAEVLECAVRSKGLDRAEALPSAAQAQVQFEARLKLARYGIAPADRASSGPRFGHPSEEVFAKLLDFYRVPWDYEPRSFPLQWDKDGKVMEAFTPDFYLPEFDLYIELTTMKQAHVTKKNRKVRLLRAIYPHINIQVYYQKDMRDLVMKYGLSERLAR